MSVGQGIILTTSKSIVDTICIKFFGLPKPSQVSSSGMVDPDAFRRMQVDDLMRRCWELSNDKEKCKDCEFRFECYTSRNNN